MDATLDLKSQELYVYAAIGAGGFVVLAVVVYLLPISKLKVPAMILSSLACLIVGLAVGILTMTAVGYHWEKKPFDGPMGPAVPPSGPAGGMAMGGPPGGGGGRAGGGAPGGGGGRGPSAKIQLGNLVTRLDALTRAPLKIELNDEQRTKVSEELKGLAEASDLTDEDAQKRLDALLIVLKSDHATLEAVGFRLPGAGGGASPSGPPPNPFMDANRQKALKDLQQRLTKGGPAG